MTYNEIKNRIATSKATDIGNVISESFALFKKAWLQGLLFFLLVFALIIVAELLIFLPAMLFAGMPSKIENGNFDVMPVALIVLFFCVTLLFVTVLGTLITGLVGGLYIVYKKIDHDEVYSAGDYFTLLRSKYIGKTLVIAMAQLGIILAFYLMCCLPVIYVSVPVSYIAVMYAFNKDLSTGKIINLSFAIGNKNWFEKFLLRIIMGFIAIISGFLLCGIGVFATFALTLIPQYIIYRDTVGFEQQSELETIGLPDGVWTE